jgi:cytidylate kinase
MTVIAMTQEMATLGKDVAIGLAAALDLKIVRHEIGDDVAERLQVKKSLIRRMREGHAGWLEKRAVDAASFALHAAEKVFDRALEGDVLIRGWGATCLLAEVRHVPCIRICAPLANRVKWLMERLDSDDPDMAREELERSDRAHAARMHANFGVNMGDPLLYDLVLNTGRVTVESCVEQLIQLSRRPEFQPTPESLAHLRNLALQAHIQTALRTSPESSDIHITVDAKDGAVALRGIVATEREREIAAEVVRGVEGVTAVTNLLQAMKRRPASP